MKFRKSHCKFFYNTRLSLCDKIQPKPNETINIDKIQSKPNETKKIDNIQSKTLQYILSLCDKIQSKHNETKKVP